MKPDHMVIIDRPDLWMDPAAIEQLTRVAATPNCARAVGMPDLHPGRGIPVGAAFAFEGHIHPPLIGGDMGCGVSLIVVPRPRKRGEAARRRFPTEPLDLFAGCDDPQAALTAIWRGGVSALATLDCLPESLRALAERLGPQLRQVDLAREPTPELPACLTRAERYLAQLGSPGGGNHFLEISQVVERAEGGGGEGEGEGEADEGLRAAEALGLTRGTTVVLAHSGSRGLGGDLSDTWAGRTLSAPEEQARYLAELSGAVRYAQCNRFILMWVALDALGCAHEDRVGGLIDLTHNEVLPHTLNGRPVWLHRKGAAPAAAGQLTVVLGTRETRSWVMLGLGAEGCLCSVAHGAGRKMGRGEALAKFKDQFTKQSLIKTQLGGDVICDQPQLLYEEHPRAYKAIEPVIASLVEAGAARRVAALEPVLTYKMSEGHG